MNKTYLILIIFILNCVLGTRNIRLNEISITRPTIKKNNTYFLILVDSRIPVRNAIFGSNSQKGEIIGHTRNGYYMPMANIVNLGNIDEWFKNSFFKSMSNSEFKFANNTKNADYTLEINLLKIYVDNYFNYHGIIEFEMKIRDKNQKIVFSKIYYNEDKDICFIGEASEYRKVLESAMLSSMYEALSDFNRLFEK